MSPGITRKMTRQVAALGAIGLFLTACSVSSDGDGDTAAQDENIGEVSMTGAGTGVDADITNTLATAASEGEDFTGTYTGSDSFEQDIIIQIEGGTPPDIGMFPQPGAVIEQAQQGNAIALEDLGFDIADLEAQYGEYLMSLGEYEGKHYGLPLDVNFKSAVWYNVPAWEAAGWGDPPATWDELIALSTEMAESGVSPFCLGTGSDAATGWPATDWMEDIVLRDQGTDVYDQWVTNDLKFDSEEIKSAASRFGEIVFGEAGGTPFVFGGNENIASTDFRDAPDPMFNDPPNCYMHRQATFIPAFFPEDQGLEPITDYNFFPFPDIEGNSGALIAGGLGAVFNNRPEIKDFLDNYTSPEVQCLIGSGDATQISANVNVDVENCYGNEIIQQAAGVIQQALNDGVARFDASDLMPPAVGSGEFWNGMNNYTNNGPDNLDEVMQAIDAAWPTS